jgi:hypothetical protein
MTAEFLVNAWRQAADDLGITLRAPYILEPGSGTDGIECIALIEDFGSSNGTVVFGRHSASELARSTAKEQGRFVSLLDEDSYSSYDRSLFIETLNDWGWFGDPDRVPEWYTGEAWSSRRS